MLQTRIKPGPNDRYRCSGGRRLDAYGCMVACRRSLCLFPHCMHQRNTVLRAVRRRKRKGNDDVSSTFELDGWVQCWNNMYQEMKSGIYREREREHSCVCFTVWRLWWLTGKLKYCYFHVRICGNYVSWKSHETSEVLEVAALMIQQYLYL